MKTPPPPPPAPAESAQPGTAGEPELPPYVIEGARSSRSKCKSCRKKIEKGILRLGILIEGPYGIGYLWHHLTCAAKRRLDDVEEAYDREAWKEAKELPEDIPDIASLRELERQGRRGEEESQGHSLYSGGSLRSRQVQAMRQDHGEGKSSRRAWQRG